MSRKKSILNLIDRHLQPLYKGQLCIIPSVSVHAGFFVAQNTKPFDIKETIILGSHSEPFENKMGGLG